jgi:hypothetical protein
MKNRSKFFILILIFSVIGYCQDVDAEDFGSIPGINVESASSLGTGFVTSIIKAGVNDSNESFNTTMIDGSEKLIEGNQTNETTNETINASSNSTIKAIDSGFAPSIK